METLIKICCFGGELLVTFDLKKNMFFFKLGDFYVCLNWVPFQKWVACELYRLGQRPSTQRYFTGYII